ncbi:MAG TPA: hypothetical protein VFH70_00425 [Acidimicrobiales bacterium]|nr:hypothetical protein [Acidimicrobiales bacterium]
MTTTNLSGIQGPGGPQPGQTTQPGVSTDPAAKGGPVQGAALPTGGAAKGGPATGAPLPATATTPGASASIAAPDTSALGQDPAYLAYLRALGVKDTTSSANAQAGIDQLNRQVALRLPQMQQDAARANQQLLGRMEARGILNSGETETNLSNQEMLQQRQQAALQDQAAQRAQQIIAQLADQRAQDAVNTAEKGLTAGQTLALTGGTQQISNDAANAAASLGI